MKPGAKIAVACVLVLLLATFGINNIGGDTWVSAGAPLPDGFQRDRHGPIHPREGAHLVPIIIVVALAAGALLDGYLPRPAEEDGASAQDEDEANSPTAARHPDTDD